MPDFLSALDTLMVTGVFSLCGAYWFGIGGAGMPLTGRITEGGTFFCPRCGALYSVTQSRLSDSNVAKCVVCQHAMKEQESTKVPIYKLVQRPEDA